LGEVNIERSKQTLFYLINETPVPAKWSLNYVAFPKKLTIGYMTKTALEIENLQKTDDPDVFQFSLAEVRIFNKYLGMPQRTINSVKSYS
jgi:hypothetical protein